MKGLALFLVVLSTSSLFSFSCKELTIEEKVGQLLMVHFHGEDVNEEAHTLIHDLHIGGIIYYNWSNGLTSPKQIKTLSAHLQQIAGQQRIPVPLLIATDQEGGVVARLQEGFTIFPGNAAVARTKNPAYAYQSALYLGDEMRAVGINMNMAPVVDINSSPQNPVIGIRSYGDSLETVLTFGKEALKGFRESEVLTVLKHYPGHGDVETDSHEDLPSVKKSKEAWENSDFIPFKTLSKEADCVMTGHLLIPSVDPFRCATLSKPLLAILRKIGYEGVIISDSLVMEGLLKGVKSIEEASLQAFEAGCDLILLGGKQLIGVHQNLELTVEEIKRIHRVFVQAVQEGRISQSRLDQSVERILALKNRHDLLCTNRMPLKEINCRKHQELAKAIATRALEIISNKPCPLQANRVVLFAPLFMKDSLEKTSFIKKTIPYYYEGLNPSPIDLQNALEKSEEGDAYIFCSYDAWKNKGQGALLNALIDTKKPLTLLVLKNPNDALQFSSAHQIFITFSPTLPSIQAAGVFIDKFF